MILKVQYLTICVIVSSIYASYYSRLLAGNQLMVVEGRWGGGGGGMRKCHVDTFSVIPMDRLSLT